MTGDVLLIFLNDPRERSMLSLALGTDKAKELNDQLEALTHTVTKLLSCKKVVVHAAGNAINTTWNTDDYITETQEGRYLNNKIEQAFSHHILQSKEDINKVIFITADCPGLTTAVIEKAFEKLNKYDVCIGPEKKGGYYLIGMKEPMPFLFSNKLWTGNPLLDDTLEELIEHGKKYFMLPELQCVNDIYDLQLLK